MKKRIVRILKKIIPRNFVLYIKYIKQHSVRVCQGMNTVCTSLEYDIIRGVHSDCFFGYYDICPFFKEGVLFCELHDSNSPIDIVLLSNDGKGKQVVSKSYAWNWQQGCRLRWMPGRDNSICYNDYADGKYFAVIKNLSNRFEEKIPIPLYDISADGMRGVSLNFERLGVMRPGYGYTNKKYKPVDLENESVISIDLNTKEDTVLFTYSDIADAIGLKERKFEKNYLNHLAFSPDGNRLLLFWLTAQGSYHKADLLVYDYQTKKLNVLETEDKVSHYVWLDNNRILCTAYNKDYQCRYYIYDVDNKTKTLVESKALMEDGHPSIYDDERIITDTYPDKNGFQHISLVNIKTGKYERIISVYSDCRIEGERRTDMHPRLSCDRKLLSFDSNIKGKREMFIVHL